jgi:hypothetical protein
MNKRPHLTPLDRRLFAAWRGLSPHLSRQQTNTRLLEQPATRPLAPDGFHELWPYIAPITAMCPWRAAGLARRLWEVKDLPGDIIECGGLAGGMSVMMALLLRRWGVDKRVYMLDAFKGLPAPGVWDAFYVQGEGKLPRAGADLVIWLAGVQDRVEVVEGWFEDTLPTLTAKTWCLAHLDGDLYQSTRTCLAFVPKRMVRGGAVVLDDCWDENGGVRQALEEYLRTTGEQLHAGPAMQGYFRKGRLAPGHNRKGVRPSAEELRQDVPYRRLLRFLDGEMRRNAKAMVSLGRILEKGA